MLRLKFSLLDLATFISWINDRRTQQVKSYRFSGPTIIDKLTNGKVREYNFQVFVAGTDEVKNKVITIDRRGVVELMKKGQRILVDDGFLVFEVVKTVKGDEGVKVEARVVEGGILKSRKGVNLPDLSFDVPVLVKRDFLFQPDNTES